jgi:DNA-binding GntR family transcriptional regulator
MGEQQRSQAVAAAAQRVGRADAESLLALTELWETAFEEGRLAALDEFQDRFCVCMK